MYTFLAVNKNDFRLKQEQTLTPSTIRYPLLSATDMETYK